jgi:hypothetical protein
MRSFGVTLQVTCSKDVVLKTLHENRGKHAAMVAEAQAGYLDRARTELTTKLSKIESGKVVHLRIDLSVPLDYTHVYDTAIHMLEVHLENQIALDADTYRHLVEDDWEWMGVFGITNSQYSPSTRAYAASKGIES